MRPTAQRSARLRCSPNLAAYRFLLTLTIPSTDDLKIAFTSNLSRRVCRSTRFPCAVSFSLTWRLPGAAKFACPLATNTGLALPRLASCWTISPHLHPHTGATGGLVGAAMCNRSQTDVLMPEPD